MILQGCSNNSKIFGIGLSRTGTTSLTTALTLLGYKAIHFPDLSLTLSLNLKIKNDLLYQFDAFTDLPISYFYKNLDKKFPNSKFILTTRDIDSWLNSCANFRRFNYKSRNLLSLDKFKRYKLRKKIYGCTHYDRELFKSAYENHVLTVKNYFKNRSDDLLIINISDGNQWSSLCDFLQKDIPDCPFPHKNRNLSYNY